jgi:arylsulfatase A-like enzyme
MGNGKTTPPIPAGPAWAALGLVSAGAAIIYVLMEWTFFATKPSFMSTLGTGERIRILLVAPLPLVAASAALCAALGLGARLAPRARGALVRAGALGPGFLLAATALLLLDNFTYTVFHFGVLTSAGMGRGAYVALVAGLWFWGWRTALGLLRKALGGRRPVRTAVVWTLGAVACWGALLATGRDRLAAPAFAADGPGPARSGPNVLILAWDGIGAEHLSLYGRDRDTTPFLRTFRPDRALRCENAFANSLNSGGSIASLLTGKQPTTLRTYYPPEILTGRHAYEHLPGILRQRGYWNLDISARQFADAYDLNLQNAFDEANGRTEGGGRWQAAAANILGLNTGYFLGATSERLRDRLLHAAGVREVESVYELVAGENAGTQLDDEPRLERLLRAIAERGDRPLFAHVHFMETHGPAFHLENPVFSKGRNQAEPFEADFYDDALRDMDAAFARIVRALEDAGQLDNTVLVLSSDHAKAWGSGRIPLVFWFPPGGPAGRIRNNAQNLDVAPTLLDYLGLPIPAWMEGTSLLAGEPPATRPIFFAAVDSRLVDTGKWRLDESRRQPPFYSLGAVGMRIGPFSYVLDLATGVLEREPLAHYIGRPADAEMRSAEEARGLLLDHLAQRGYAIPEALKAAPAAQGL